MTNHPNRSRTYWYSSPRGFANEYDVGIATTAEKARHYANNGYERINRERALRELSNSGDAATKVYASVTINGSETNASRQDVAHSLRNGTPL